MPPLQLTMELPDPLYEPGQRHSNAAKRAHDRRRVLVWFLDNLTGTADDCAEGLGMDRLCVRPRTSELLGLKLLIKRPDLPRKSTGIGGTAGVLEITLKGERIAREMQESEAAA